MPVPVAARSKAYVCGRSLAEIVGSNPTGGMDVCLLWVLCVVRLRSLRRADHSSRGVLPTVVRRCVWSRNLKNEEATTHDGSQRHSKRNQEKCNHLQLGNSLSPCNFASSSIRCRRYLPEILLHLGLYWIYRKQLTRMVHHLEVGQEWIFPHRKKKNIHTHTQHLTKCHTGPRTWTDPLKRPEHHKTGSACGLVVANSYEEDNEPSVQ